MSRHNKNHHGNPLIKKLESALKITLASPVTPGVTTVRRRILFALCSIAVGLFCVLGFLHRFEARQAMALAQHDCDERALYFGKIIQLSSSALKSIDSDNSYWDDMVKFAKKPDKTWATRNIDSIIDPEKVDGMWVFGTDGKLIYGSTSADIPAMRNNPIPTESIRKFLSSRASCHFFVKFNSSMVEMYGATIVPSTDPSHLTKPCGYLLTGRLWDQNYITKMEQMTNSDAHVVFLSPAVGPEDASTTGDKITYSTACSDWTGKQIGRLYLQTLDPTFTALQASSQRVLVYAAIFGALLMFSVSACLLLWVSNPIETIVKALRAENPVMLESLTKESTEFGTIARLVDDFVTQQQELRTARDYLEIIVDERTKELEQANDRLSRSYEAVIAGWGRALDLRDHETEGHCVRVTQMTMRLAKLFGFDEDELMHIERGALLHDIGKMGVPDNILLKNGELTEEERELMQMHTVYAYEMLYPIEFLRPALDIPFCHHEKWDGTGYPRSLKGEEIPLSARIFAIADVSDALSSDRPYRAAWPPQRVRDHIRKLSGTHFDPHIVEAYLVETIGDEDIRIDFGDELDIPDFRQAA
jgi:putative nucleotidyltransferase with HDIG domain